MTKMPRLGLPWWAVHAARNLGHRAERALALVVMAVRS
jgi:hypothetical protein